jgi:hypothetical protein
VGAGPPHRQVHAPVETRSHQSRRSAIGTNVNHVHIKTKDPVATAYYYVDNFGARIRQDGIPDCGLPVDLHELRLTPTAFAKANSIRAEAKGDKFYPLNVQIEAAHRIGFASFVVKGMNQ